MNDPTFPPKILEIAATDLESQACWNRIGVQGDRTCPEIPKHVHCRNCHVYANAGSHLFNRQPPQEWLDANRARLAELDAPLESDTITVLVFRLSDECIAFDVRSVLEVAEPRYVHRVPHRTGGNMEGIVNIRGELELCVSLARLLNLDESPLVMGASKKSRFLVTEHGRQRWVIPVDEVLGVHRLSRKQRTELPATLRRSSSRLSRHVYDWEGNYVCHLDADRLFASMQKGLQ
jgi:chemotaxis-related protein WspD